jgi:Mn2+/Fe2+ NRAMP family transporter
VFLGLFTGLVVLGAAIALLPINVIKLLIGMQVLNGLLLPVVLVSLVRLTNDPELMGEHRNGRVVNVIAWLTVGFVVALSTTYLVITILGLFGIGPGG